MSGGADGLTTIDANARLRRDGPNAVPEARRHEALDLLARFSGPVPWMLEIVFVLEILERNVVDALVVLVLLSFNATLGWFQERRSRDALALLRKRLRVTARVRRDGAWSTIEAERLVVDDVVHVRVGDLVPADVRWVEGSVLLDASTLTGESFPVEATSGDAGHAGTIVRRGEATGVVTATGTRTKFGRTAELVRTAKSESHLERLVLRVVKALVAVDVSLAIVVVAAALLLRLPLRQLAPYVLMLVVASVPVALPATFTVATALGALDLAHRGVLVTRLSAVEEAAAMQVLCSDKTGTLTQNALRLVDVRAFLPATRDEVLELAALASDRATQDPIDLAILAEAPSTRDRVRAALTPFDPATKRAEAIVIEDGARHRVTKGAPRAIASAVGGDASWMREVESMSEGGRRVLAVASDRSGALAVAGLVAFEDPPRDDAAPLIEELRRLGVRVTMVTGDGEATARSVARAVGLRGDVGRVDDAASSDVDVVAGVLPEEKHEVVRALQRSGVVVGMTGDGVNDAPALKQAEVGVAVSSATDVAKAAASLVLTDPGLRGIVAAIRAGRSIYQRMLTYTLNKIVKTLEIGGFLTIGFLVTGAYVTSPRHVLLLLFTNDFLTMAIATDDVEPSPRPDRWDVRTLVVCAAVLAAGWLLFSLGIVLVARAALRLELGAVHTLAFVVLVFGGQANVYLVRERRRLWASRPSRWMITASVVDLVVVSAMATFGVLMTPIRPVLVTIVAAAAISFAFALDFVKIGLFGRLRVGGANGPRDDEARG